MGRHEVASPEPAAAQVRAAADLDTPDLVREVFLSRAGGGEGDDAHLVVEGHHAHGVVRREAAHEHRCGLQGGLELRSGHGARPVEHQREVEGGAVAVLRGLALDAQQGVDHPPAVRDGLVVQEHGGLHAISVVEVDGAKIAEGCDSQPSGAGVSRIRPTTSRTRDRISSGSRISASGPYVSAWVTTQCGSATWWQTTTAPSSSS